MKLITNIRPGIDRLIFCFPMVCAVSKINTLIQFMSELNCTRILSTIDNEIIFEAAGGYFKETLVFKNSKDYFSDKDKSYLWVIGSVINDPGDEVILLRKRS